MIENIKDSIQLYDERHPYQNKTTNVMRDTDEPIFDMIPNEILCYIISFMNPLSLEKFSQVDHRCREAVHSIVPFLLERDFSEYVNYFLVPRSSPKEDYLMLYRYPFIVSESHGFPVPITIPKTYDGNNYQGNPVWFPTLDNIRYPPILRYFEHVNRYDKLYTREYKWWYGGQVMKIIGFCFDPDPFPKSIATIFWQFANTSLSDNYMFLQQAYKGFDALISRRLFSNLQWIYQMEPDIIHGYIRHLEKLLDREEEGTVDHSRILYFLNSIRSVCFENN